MHIGKWEQCGEANESRNRPHLSICSATVQSDNGSEKNNFMAHLRPFHELSKYFR